MIETVERAVTTFLMVAGYGTKSPRSHREMVETDTLERFDNCWAEATKAVPRGYHLAFELQKEAGLRAIEASERLKASSLLALEGGRGRLSVIGKGGRVREVTVSKDLYERLAAHLVRRPGESLAPRRAYLAALRRAALAAGGRATGSHAHRRTAAVELKNRLYRKNLNRGMTPEQASLQAIRDTVEHLVHSRIRQDVAAAYPRTKARGLSGRSGGSESQTRPTISRSGSMI